MSESSFKAKCLDGNRLFRQRVVSPTVILQTSLVSSQTCWSQFAIFGFEIKRYEHLYVNPDANLGFNYTIQNTTLHVVCINYWIWNIENIYFLLKCIS